jgi:hypothetical protein
MKLQLASAVAILLTAVAGTFAEQASRRVSWSEFQREAARVRINGRVATISIRGGEPVRCLVKTVREDGLVVEPGRKTKQWARTSGEHRIPREMIASVSSMGRMGHKRILGAAIGVGAAVAMGAAVGQTQAAPGNEGRMGVIVGAGLALPGFLGGYLVGYYLDESIPAYEIVPDAAMDESALTPAAPASSLYWPTTR